MYGESPEKTQRRTMMSRLPDIVDSISLYVLFCRSFILFYFSEAETGNSISMMSIVINYKSRSGTVNPLSHLINIFSQ